MGFIAGAGTRCISGRSSSSPASRFFSGASSPWSSSSPSSWSCRRVSSAARSGCWTKPSASDTETTGARSGGGSSVQLARETGHSRGLNPRTRRSLRAVLLAVVLATVVWASWRHVSDHMSLEGMRALVDSHARYGPLVFMAMVVAGIFTRVPMAGTLLIAMGAVLFGPFRAFAYGWAAALVGTTSTFLLVRYVARDYLQHMFYGFSTRLRALDDRLARNG